MAYNPVMMPFVRFALVGVVVAGLASQLPGCVRVGTGGSGPLVSDQGLPAPSARRDVRAPNSANEATRTGRERPSEDSTLVVAESTEREQDWEERGTASWYGEAHHGKATASGEPFDMYAMTAAHPSLEMGTRVEVENLANGRTVIVRINDRGPFTEDRVIDLSMAAAQALGFASAGTAEVGIRPLR